METFADKLKAARLRKGFKQSDVAAELDCAPTSLTNWESGKIQPSLDVLAKLCEVLEISPLSLLRKEYSFRDLAVIAAKPSYERSYEDQVALNFSSDILEKLMPAEIQRQETRRIEKTAAFLRDYGILDRFGQLNRKQIEGIQADYDTFGKADKDIVFAYHALTNENKRAFLDILHGLLCQPDNVQMFSENMDRALTYTLGKLGQQAKELRYPVRTEEELSTE